MIKTLKVRGISLFFLLLKFYQQTEFCVLPKKTETWYLYWFDIFLICFEDFKINWEIYGLNLIKITFLTCFSLMICGTLRHISKEKQVRDVSALMFFLSVFQDESQHRNKRFHCDTKFGFLFMEHLFFNQCWRLYFPSVAHTIISICYVT